MAVDGRCDGEQLKPCPAGPGRGSAPVRRRLDGGRPAGRSPAVGQNVEDFLDRRPVVPLPLDEHRNLKSESGECGAGEVAVFHPELVGDGRAEGVGVPDPHALGVRAQQPAWSPPGG